MTYLFPSLSNLCNIQMRMEIVNFQCVSFGEGNILVFVKKMAHNLDLNIYMQTQDFTILLLNNALIKREK